MRHLIGQGARHTGRLLHWIAEIGIALLFFFIVGVGALAWRLEEGPLELPWLVGRLEAAVNSSVAPAHVSIGMASLTWEGFHGGSDRPLDIRLMGVRATDADGRLIADIPRAAVTLATRALLLGRIVPYAAELDGVHLSLIRTPDGDLAFDTGQPEAGPGADTSLTGFINDLRRVRLRELSLTVADRKLGLSWQATQVSLDLRQPVPGQFSGTAAATLDFAGQHLDLTAEAAPRHDHPGTTLQFALTPLTPAALATAAPAFAPLAAVDAPVRFSGAADLDAGFTPAALRIEAQVGGGRVLLGRSALPVMNALVQASGTPERFNLELARLELAPRESGPSTVVQGTAAVQRNSGAVRATVDLALDQVAFADLPALWPEGVGGPGARWVTENITSGVAGNGRLLVALQAPADLSDAQLLSITGGIDGHDLTVHWLRPMPPIEHAEARLSFASSDEIDIAVRSGHEGALTLNGGKVSVTGISGDDQFADISVDLAGPLAEAVALLKHPRLNLFARRPLPLQGVSGGLNGQVSVAHLPLRDQLSMDDVHISASGTTTDAHLSGIVAGKDLDQGALQWQASNDGMKVGGSAVLAGIPAQLSAELDFRSGPPAQVLQKIGVSGTAQARQLADAGLDVSGMISGSAGLQGSWQSRRDGSGDVSVRADLASAGLRVARLHWSKPTGRPATADIHLLLDHESLVRIDRLAVTGSGIDAQGQLDFVAGHPTVLRLQRLRLDPSTDASAEIRWPARAGAPWIISASGTSLDASAEFEHDKSGQDKKKHDERGPAFTVDATFGRVVVGEGRALGNVKVHAVSDGLVTSQAQLSGETTRNAPFSISITPAAGGRRLRGSGADAGALLRALDVVDTLDGGRLTLSGVYDDARPDHPLSGLAEISDFRVRNAAALGKLLQAMTLYGLVDASGGPGLGFKQLVAPFTLTDDVLDIGDARAYSSSLGLTAKGKLNFVSNVCDVQGTIVPAYFFNSLLGSIPFVGKLFSPETGGGVFAATYSITGDCDNPSVGVNPLAALTPGFLRGLFEGKGSPSSDTNARGATQ